MKAIEKRQVERLSDEVVNSAHKILCFKDDKSDTYGPPFTVETLGMFIRSLVEELESPAKKAIWAKHPQDFGVFELGLYHPGSGSILLHDQKKCLGLVQDFSPSSGVKSQ